MKQSFGRMLLALVVIALVHGTAAPASAALNMTQIDMNDTSIGGWTTSPNPGIFHLFVIQGSNPFGPIINSGTDQPINIPLADGTYEFTLLGNNNAGSESTLSSPGPTLTFYNGVATTTLRVSTAAPSGMTTLGGSTIRVSNFTFIPWQQSGINRVTNHFVGASGPEGAYNDAVARFTIEVSSLPSGLVSWWRAEGNFNDSADGNNGIAVNTVNFVPGRTGQAFSFNGSAMRVPSSANLNFGTGNFSGSMWVKTSVGGGFIVEKDISGVNNPDWFVHLTGGQVRFVVGQGAGGGDPYTISSARIDDGRFHHVAWVRNGTTLSVYIDGALSGQANASFVGNVSNGVQFVLGAEIYNDATNSLVNASVSVIDEVALFNRALSAAEILSISGDLQPPVIALNGANPMTLECPEGYFEPGASVSDSSDPSPDLDISGSVDSHTPGTYVITYTATDASGNTSTATRTVTVVDTTPPAITLNGLVPVIECHVGTYTEPGASALDACDGPVAVTTSGSVDSHTPGLYTITYTATDASGNSAFATRAVSVVDTTPPAIALNGASPLTLEFPTAYAEAGATASDLCDPAPTLSISGTVNSHITGTYTITYTATDNYGNTASATRTVNVVDTTPPVVTAPASVVAEATGSQTVVNLGNATASDAVGVVSLTNNAPATWPVSTEVRVVTWTARDAAGNIGIATQEVLVRDTTPPVIAAPASVVAEATGSQTIVDLGNATATDAVGVVSLTNNAPATWPVSTEVRVVTWTARDAAGNISIATQEVLVRDTTAPALIAPAAVTVEATGSQTIVDLGNATATDAVGVVSLTNDAPATYPVSTEVRVITWTARDAAGNISIATQEVLVRDTTPPVVTVPADVTAEATGPLTAVSIGTATAIDVVGVVSLSSNAPASFPVGTTVVTWTATDAAGNSGTATQNIKVGDLTAPVVTAPAGVTAEATGPFTALSIGTATATDAVGVVSLSSNAPASFPVGTTVVTWTATDAAGNSGTATQNVILTDTITPTLTLNGANPLLLELGTPYTEPGASASDLVDGDLTAAIQISGGVNSNTEGSYTLTYSVGDAAGNTASASRTVQVLVTPNSYGLIATHSLHLRQNAQIHSGFAGVVNRGQAPFLAGKVELVVGTRVQTGEEVRLSAPRVRVRQNASIEGELVYNQLVSVGKRATIDQQTQVPSSYFPLFQDKGLPAFLTGTPGSQDVEVKQKKSATLAAGAYDEVSVKQKGTLTFTGGTYHLGDLDVGPNAEIRFLAPTVLLIRGQLSLDQGSTFGPASGASISAADILVYVEGRNGRLGKHHDDDEEDDEEDDVDGRALRKTPRAAKIGVRVVFQGNLYAPNGTLHLRQGSVCVGSFIARDLIVGVRTQVAAHSGWNTPGVIYQPTPPAPLAKLAGAENAAAALPNGTGLLANYPNPFNPSTTIPYVLAEAGLVKLSVYNVLGQQIRVLVDQLHVPGSYTVSWDGQDAAGMPVAGGVYFYRLQAGEHSAVQKMLFAK